MPFPETWLFKTIENAAGCAAHPAYVPRDAVPPFVCFRRDATDRQRHTVGNAGRPVASFQVFVVARQYFDGKRIAEAIRLAVDGFAGEADGCTIDSVAIRDEADGDAEFFTGDDRPTYTVALAFDVRFHEEV